MWPSFQFRAAIPGVCASDVSWGRVSPVDYPLTVQVFKATAYLSSVEDGPLLVEARVAHVVDVKL